MPESKFERDVRRYLQKGGDVAGLNAAGQRLAQKWTHPGKPPVRVDPHAGKHLERSLGEKE